MSKITHLNVDDVNCFCNDKGQCIVFSWSANIGWGELTIYRNNENENWKAETECMCRGEDKEFIKMVLDKWVYGIEVVE